MWCARGVRGDLCLDNYHRMRNSRERIITRNRSSHDSSHGTQRRCEICSIMTNCASSATTENLVIAASHLREFLLQTLRGQPERVRSTFWSTLPHWLIYHDNPLRKCLFIFKKSIVVIVCWASHLNLSTDVGEHNIQRLRHITMLIWRDRVTTHLIPGLFSTKHMQSVRYVVSYSLGERGFQTIWLGQGSTPSFILTAS